MSLVEDLSRKDLKHKNSHNCLNNAKNICAKETREKEGRIEWFSNE